MLCPTARRKSVSRSARSTRVTPSPLGRAQQICSAGGVDGCDARVDLELLHGALQVGLDGRGRDAELVADNRQRSSGGDLSEHLDFSPREPCTPLVCAPNGPQLCARDVPAAVGVNSRLYDSIRRRLTTHAAPRTRAPPYGLA